ncbi:hypothetical protein B0T16DRAFT_373859 [Cercophora newfieldiana]|uniref:Zn(2)-C6 fungal-type domain-containing protein n=1 Tax=Cercophora newfieldiana TaxID=92897 RepID=A0AA39Y473_9PEZI|nr:hypothetical protein B0T16DRAFT_373859 [Cercophora newfieldiana]
MQKPPKQQTRARAKASRSTTSCTECQRRKQKCDQGQPCANCKRRFPEPVCEYGPRSKRIQSAGLGGAPNPDRPTFVVSLPPIATVVQRREPTLTPAPITRPGSRTHVRKAPVPKSPRGTRRRPSGFVVKWSGIDMTTEYPVYDSDDDSEDGDASAWETIREPASQEDGVSTHLISYDSSISRVTSPVTSSSTTTNMVEILNLAGIQRHHSQNLWHLAGPLDGMTNLPIEATKQNAMLVHTFGKMLHQFKGSFDGDPDPDNPFISDYVPWCIQSPLLAQTSLYISARSLTENQHIDQTSTMKLKGAAISTLNRHLQSEMWISDEALAAVVQFVSIEWFFGGPEVVQAHLRGLREMLRLRGGFSSSGVGALVTKVALVDDAVIAMSFESAPVLQRGPGFDFDYREPPLEQFMARFNSPLLYGPFTFSSCVEALGLHPTTASMLDDMRFLITTVLNLGPQPSTQEITKLQSTAMWIHDRISKLPLDLPSEPSPLPERSKASNSAQTPAQKGSEIKGESEPKPHSLLPHYPEYVTSMPEVTTNPLTTSENHLPSLQQANPRDPSDTRGPGPKLAPLRTPAVEPPTRRPEPDALYAAVRLAAPLYARAIGTRQPLSHVCSPADALAVLGATWRIPLARWRAVIGILLFTLISIVATASGSGDGPKRGDEGMMGMLQQYSGFVKAILQMGFMQMSLESWEVCRETMGRLARLLGWLREGVGQKKGEKGVGQKKGEKGETEGLKA